ncbi:hypothetical protein LSTR_LSTR016476 [Laodelphax striatellus]|uniref:Uncharacterized protein n=1 Tax=Laodelphax striatellus TaxID=195883 RepID=A0A482WJP4_LAOST|nr:hypothetical protein LSTR_LSTR016476 [Laodelphax striatellus]
MERKKNKKEGKKKKKKKKRRKRRNEREEVKEVGQRGTEGWQRSEKSSTPIAHCERPAPRRAAQTKNSTPYSPKVPAAELFHGVTAARRAEARRALFFLTYLHAKYSSGIFSFARRRRGAAFRCAMSLTVSK